MAVEENVDTFTDRGRHSNDTIHCRATVEHADEVGKIIKDGQIVFNDDNVIIWTQERANNCSCLETLLDVQIGRGLVEHVDISLLDTYCSNGEALQFSTGQEVDITIQNMVQLCI